MLSTVKTLATVEKTTFFDQAVVLYSALGFRTCPPYYTILETF